jgi:hypothetical protein
MSTLAQLVPAWDTSDRAQLVGAFGDDAPLAVISDVDGGNVSAASVVIDNSGTHPIITLDTRSSAGAWRHALFALDNAAGLRPIFRLNRASRTTTATPAADWLPCYTTNTANYTSWVLAPARTLVGGSSGYIEWQFTDALPAGRVFIATQPMGRVSDATALAASLLTTHSAVASPSLGADVNGVFETSPAENDEAGRAIGANPMYSIRLAFGGATTDGRPKREHVMLAQVHAAGEATSWIPFRYSLDWILSGGSQAAQDFRANFNVTLVFACTPNGLRGGHRRTNFRNGFDPNREWDSSALAEVNAIKSHLSAVVAATGRVDSFVSWHGWSDGTSPFMAYVTTEDNDAGTRSVYTQSLLTKVESILGVGPTLDTAGTNNTDIWWAKTQGAKVYIDCETQQNGSTALATYQSTGEAWMRGLQLMDAAGEFFDGSLIHAAAAASAASTLVSASSAAAGMAAASGASASGVLNGSDGTTGSPAPAAGAGVTQTMVGSSAAAASLSVAAGASSAQTMSPVAVSASAITPASGASSTRTLAGSTGGAVPPPVAAPAPLDRVIRIPARGFGMSNLASLPVPTILKDPEASLRYGVDVVDVLHPLDAVSNVTAAADAGITVTEAAYAGTILSARVAGGTAGVTYALTFSWDTLGGDTDQRTIHIAVVER